MSDDIEIYRRPGDVSLSRSQGEYLGNMEYHQRRAARRNVFWQDEAKAQIEMTRLECEFEDARQSLEALKKYGPQLRALQYEKRCAEARRELRAIEAMIAQLDKRGDSGDRTAGDRKQVILQALLERRERLEADGQPGTEELDQLIESLR